MVTVLIEERTNLDLVVNSYLCAINVRSLSAISTSVKMPFPCFTHQATLLILCVIVLSTKGGPVLAENEHSLRQLLQGDTGELMVPHLEVNA